MRFGSESSMPQLQLVTVGMLLRERPADASHLRRWSSDGAPMSGTGQPAVNTSGLRSRVGSVAVAQGGAAQTSCHQVAVGSSGVAKTGGDLPAARTSRTALVLRRVDCGHPEPPAEVIFFSSSRRLRACQHAVRAHPTQSDQSIIERTGYGLAVTDPMDYLDRRYENAQIAELPNAPIDALRGSARPAVKPCTRPSA
jgi:hypothetical protein